MRYCVSYKHNGNGEDKGWKYGTPVAQKNFKTLNEAITWINNTSGITPLKLLEWNDDIDCFSTIKTF